jgi:iron(II)-dependent oxidoreductase
VADAWPGGIPAGCRDRVVQALLATTRDDAHVPPRRRADAGRLLAELGDPRPEVTTLDGMQFCLVPAGQFLMGSGDSDPEASDREKPLHELEIPYDFWIGRYPVTAAQWREYAGASACQPGDPDSLKGADNEPAIRVSWEEARDFCAWLTEHWRAAGRLPVGFAVRLPSEAEWEKAARGGLRLPEGCLIGGAAGTSPPPPLASENDLSERRYPWGDQPDPSRATQVGSEIGRPSAVGCFPGGRSPYGAEELAGNVWEWTRSVWGRDPYRASYCYPYVPSDGREREAAGREVLRVVRGGSYFDNSWLVRCAARFRLRPDVRGVYVGFRVVVSPFTSGL